MALVYSTDHGRTCPGCRQPLAHCICKAAKPIPAGDGIVRVSREKTRGGGVMPCTRRHPHHVHGVELDIARREAGHGVWQA